MISASSSVSSAGGIAGVDDFDGTDTGCTNAGEVGGDCCSDGIDAGCVRGVRVGVACVEGLWAGGDACSGDSADLLAGSAGLPSGTDPSVFAPISADAPVVGISDGDAGFSDGIFCAGLSRGFGLDCDSFMCPLSNRNCELCKLLVYHGLARLSIGWFLGSKPVCRLKSLTQLKKSIYADGLPTNGPAGSVLAGDSDCRSIERFGSPGPTQRGGPPKHKDS